MVSWMLCIVHYYNVSVHCKRWFVPVTSLGNNNRQSYSRIPIWNWNWNWLISPRNQNKLVETFSLNMGYNWIVWLVSVGTFLPCWKYRAGADIILGEGGGNTEYVTYWRWSSGPTIRHIGYRNAIWMANDDILLQSLAIPTPPSINRKHCKYNHKQGSISVICAWM